MIIRDSKIIKKLIRQFLIIVSFFLYMVREFKNYLYNESEEDFLRFQKDFQQECSASMENLRELRLETANILNNKAILEKDWLTLKEIFENDFFGQEEIHKYVFSENPDLLIDKAIYCDTIPPHIVDDSDKFLAIMESNQQEVRVEKSERYEYEYVDPMDVHYRSIFWVVIKYKRNIPDNYRKNVDLSKVFQDFQNNHSLKRQDAIEQFCLEKLMIQREMGPFLSKIGSELGTLPLNEQSEEFRKQIRLSQLQLHEKMHEPTGDKTWGSHYGAINRIEGKIIKKQGIDYECKAQKVGRKKYYYLMPVEQEIHTLSLNLSIQSPKNWFLGFSFSEDF